MDIDRRRYLGGYGNLLRASIMTLPVLLVACSDNNPPKDERPVIEILNHELDTTLSKLSGWEFNEQFVTSLVMAQLRAGQCQRGADNLSHLLGDEQFVDMDAVSGRKKRQQLTRILGIANDNAGGACFSSVSSQILGALDKFEAPDADDAAAVANTLATLYRRQNQDAKADEVLLVAAEQYRRASNGPSNSFNETRALIEHVTAYAERGDRAQAVELLKRLWNGDAQPFGAPDGIDPKPIAGAALQLKEYDLFFHIIEGYERELWLKVLANIYGSSVLAEAPPEVALKFISYASPSARGESLLSIFFEKEAYKNPANVKPFAPVLFEWIFDNMKRAEAMAQYGGWLGHDGDIDGGPWCVKARDDIKRERQKRIGQDVQKIDNAIRALGGCVYGVGGMSLLEEEQKQFFSLQHKSALLAGAAQHLIVYRSWNEFAALVKLIRSPDEQYRAWLDLLNLVQNDRSIKTPPSLADILASQVSSQTKDTSKRHLAMLLNLLMPAGDGEQMLAEQVTLSFAEKMQSQLREAKALNEQGNIEPARDLMWHVARRVSKTESPEWMAGAILSFGALGAWDVAVDTLHKMKNPIERAQVILGLYSVYSGQTDLKTKAS